MILYQDCPSRHDLSKNIAARGRGLFSLYISIENFKNLLVRNHWTDFINTWQKSFLLTLNQDCSSYHDLSKKHCRRVVGGEGGLISLYINIEKFKNLLVRNQWTNFNIAWQECCFGDLLPRLFKPSWFVKKHGCQGVGLIFPIYLYRKL